MLSLLITDITNPFFTTLARGAEDTAKRNGYKLLFGNSDENYGKEADYVDMILSTRVDGVLFAPAGDASFEQLQRLRRHRIPFVVLDREVPGIDADQVLGDSREGSRKLVEYLLSLGHTRIALVNGRADVSTARHRFQGYSDALKLGDVPFDPELVAYIGYTAFENDGRIDRLLDQPNPPTAIFAANNFIAQSIIRSLRAKGLRVPDDMSVVAYDDFGPVAEIDPFLTVARQPAYQFGSLGMELLISRIQGVAGSERRNIILPSELVIRQSAAKKT